MTAAEVWQLAQDPRLLIAGLAAAALLVCVVVWIVRRVQALVRSERPDEPLSTVATLIGLGWTSESVWEITGNLGWALSVRLLLMFVLEAFLLIGMIRAKRAMRELGHTGRSGQSVWLIASAMSLVAVGVAGSVAEAAIRLAIPLLIVLSWWNGVIGEGKRSTDGVSSWRWTPRRLFLWLGAIEPGERDVEQVHRERLTQQMTDLEFKRRHGAKVKIRERAAQKLMRLSLTADDEITAEVRRRADRSAWFEAAHPAPAQEGSSASVDAAAARAGLGFRLRHRRSVRTVRVAHPPQVITAAQDSRRDERTAQEIDQVIRAIVTTMPNLPKRRVARLAGTSPTTARRVLDRIAGPDVAHQVNGHNHTKES